MRPGLLAASTTNQAAYNVLCPMADPLIQVLSLRGNVLIWLCWVVFFAWFKNGNNTDRSLQNQSNCTMSLSHGFSAHGVPVCVYSFVYLSHSVARFWSLDKLLLVM